jgi:hypothetical protein
VSDDVAAATRTPAAALRPWVDRARALRARPWPRALPWIVSPGGAMAAISVAILAVYARLSGFTRATDFLVIGVPHGTAAGVGSLASHTSTYDAQFAYFMARFPGQDPPHVYDDAPIRWSRMLQPLLVRLVALGRVDLLPWAFLAVGVASVALGTALLGHLLALRGQSRWIALAYGLYAGTQLALVRDLADPLAILWLMVAIWGLLRRSPLQVGAALGLALLTREALLPFVPLLLLPQALRRQWGALAGAAALALAPFAIWQGLLRLWLGKWGFMESGRANKFARLPFSGAFHAYLSPHFGLVLAFVVVPTVLVWIVAAADILERGLLPSLLEPLAVVALAYTVLFAFQNFDHWNDMWVAGRLFAPALPFVLPLRPRAVGAVRAGLLTVLLLSGCILGFGVVWG